MVVISRLTPIMKSRLKKIAIQFGLVAAIGLSEQSQEDGRHYRIIKNSRFKVKEDMIDLDGLKNLFKVIGNHWKESNFRTFLLQNIEIYFPSK